MALLDRDGPDLAGFDRRLLVVAAALGLLTLLAVLDLHRPVPGSERPVEVRIPLADWSPAASAVPPRRMAPDPDDLLVHD